MMISMDMESGAWTYADPQDDAGQAPGGTMSQAARDVPELALGLQEIPLARPRQSFGAQHAQALLRELGRYQGE